MRASFAKSPAKKSIAAPTPHKKNYCHYIVHTADHAELSNATETCWLHRDQCVEEHPACVWQVIRRANLVHRSLGNIYIYIHTYECATPAGAEIVLYARSIGNFNFTEPAGKARQRCVYIVSSAIRQSHATTTFVALINSCRARYNTAEEKKHSRNWAKCAWAQPRARDIDRVGGRRRALSMIV